MIFRYRETATINNLRYPKVNIGVIGDYDWTFHKIIPCQTLEDAENWCRERNLRQEKWNTSYWEYEVIGEGKPVQLRWEFDV